MMGNAGHEGQLPVHLLHSLLPPLAFGDIGEGAGPYCPSVLPLGHRGGVQDPPNSAVKVPKSELVTAHLTRSLRCTHGLQELSTLLWEHPIEHPGWIVEPSVGRHVHEKLRSFAYEDEPWNIVLKEQLVYHSWALICDHLKAVPLLVELLVLQFQGLLGAYQVRDIV